MKTKTLTKWTQLSLSGLIITSVLVACGDSQFKLKDFTGKVKITATGNKAEQKTSTQSAGTLSVSPKGTTAVAQPEKIITTEKDKDGAPKLAIKTSQELDLHGEKVNLVIGKRTIEKIAGEKAKFQVSADFELAGTAVKLEKAEFTETQYLNVTKSNEITLKNGNQASVYINSICRINTDDECKTQIFILHILLENGNHDEDLVKQVGISFFNDTIMIFVDKDGDEQMDIKSFEDLLRSNLDPAQAK